MMYQDLLQTRRQRPSDEPVYLDCNATTPLDPAVRKVLLHFLDEDFGNEGSRTHAFGARAKQAVQRARDQVAAVVGAKRDEVIFTSGATESNNLAHPGAARGGGVGGPAACHHDPDRTQGGAGALRGAGARGLRGHAGRGGPLRGGGPGGDPRRTAPGDLPGLGDAGQQRDRGAPTAGRHRRGRWTDTRPGSTPTPLRASARTWNRCAIRGSI